MEISDGWSAREDLDLLNRSFLLAPPPPIDLSTGRDPSCLAITAAKENHAEYQELIIAPHGPPAHQVSAWLYTSINQSPSRLATTSSQALPSPQVPPEPSSVPKRLMPPPDTSSAPSSKPLSSTPPPPPPGTRSKELPSLPAPSDQSALQKRLAPSETLVSAISQTFWLLP
ncbi:hypothetical protein PCANC_28872 [Puccinia coronata f. sp. avenae]|uniref:Uncharacterized protein n=1 Tax=Puccinia coronata f. sp. avenae TaxID=200324 RepID=A0A2N5TI35_9BASI|nr:hypothetical protein PCANC_28872 [Puccinia coronata f. sp. avenae]